MPRLEINVSPEGEISYESKGIKGKACRPLFDKIAADLSHELGIETAEHHDTSEANEQPERSGAVRQATSVRS
jgi:hypothetical protein